MKTLKISALACAAALVVGTVVPAAAEDHHGSHADTGFRTSWTPTSSDTCTQAAHAKFAVTGPDGKKYDGWHPATTTDPATGQTCTFGHEHGDDPRTSRIYDWTIKNLGGKADGIAFGYAGQQSMVAAEHGGSLPHRHEDHVGYKIYVRNDVKILRSDRSGYVRDASGRATTCDYLIMVHQGSHSGDALRNNAHELMYSVRCSDGTGLTETTLTGFGQPNEYQSVCDDRTVKTSGSDLPRAAGGARRIPDTVCAEKTVQSAPRASSDVWGLYERWEADSRLTLPDGTVLSRVDPWFGVRNPSRIADGDRAVPTATLAGAATLGWPWTGLPAGLAQNDPASPFNGARRDFYVQHSTVRNAGGPTVWYTDPYGGNASRTPPFPGSIRQYVSATDNSTAPEPERRLFGMSTDYAPKGSGVHAPN